MEKILVRENLATPLEILNFSYNLSKLSIGNEVAKDFELEVDKTLFCQCLLNIFKNAVEHQIQTKQDHILISMWNGAKSLYISNPYIVDGSIMEKKSINFGMKFVTQALNAMGLGFQKSIVNGNFLLTISAP